MMTIIFKDSLDDGRAIACEVAVIAIPDDKSATVLDVFAASKRRHATPVIHTVLTFDPCVIMMKALLDTVRCSLVAPAYRAVRRIALSSLLVGGAIWSHACVSGERDTYGPYEVVGYNYTDRGISRFFIDGHGVGSSYPNESGGGGGIYCCHDIPKRAKTLHIKVELEWTKEQYEKHLPHDTFETDIPVPPLSDKHDGFIEFHFLPQHRVEASWVSFPTTPNIPNTH